MLISDDNIFKEIRAIFFEAWDPLKVSGNSKLKDEYDDFIPRIIPYLSIKNISNSEIEGMLLLFEDEIRSRTCAETRALVAILLLEKFRNQP